jgi:23S rRNA pseudouridine1911/1915/1917 synthase
LNRAASAVPTTARARASSAMARLLDILATRHPGASRRTLRQMLAHGRVTVDGRIVTRASTEVPEGADVALGRKRAAPSAWKGVDVVYEDRHLLVIDKPPGVLSVASGAGGTASAWADVRRYLARTHQEPYLVHRLDKPVSGLLVFAKSVAVQESLQDTFARHDLERVYVAVVEGGPRTDEGVVRTRLLESDRRPFKVRSVRAADPPDLRARAELASTRWRVLVRAGRTALLVWLETGKKHQIRVHLAELGCPIIGDHAYGGPACPRLLLHATLLRFPHPVTGAQVQAISQPDSAFRRACPRLPDLAPALAAPGVRGLRK